ncbi:phosphoglycerol transferase MdoB-like AlkP superfamily enzyme [Pasteurella langaaensis DSM 22999]|uniref:Phosphoglycerol transferase MdoB-like AlkP superfamily enzyme n=1 Tax=Alitibacter langaaensis DSM 22999 TaxID=1122935 RepID=A0A2U0T897_9PAST|nr:LTA synthase family protein [Pasteurella langaaensis]PVX39767.1 phosphoglycerol transferase MdoB-like AlkP superfamily enzyme [Pasteurella langaaensis DSM 22999]
MSLAALIFTLWILFAYFQTILFLHRRRMAKAFISAEIHQSEQYQSALKRMTTRGARFDAKVIAIVLAPFFLFGSASLAFFSINTTAIFWSIYILIFAIALIGIVVGNFYYYKTYNNYYDMFMFGLVEDDTKAVLKNIYDDYPVISGSLAVLALALISAGITFYGLSHWFLAIELHWTLSSLLFVISLLVLAFFVRGTIRSTPLGKNHAQVASLAVINKLVPNGVIAMEWAFGDRKRNINFEAVDLEQGKALMQQAFGTESLLERTPKNDALAETKPHVVLAVMESFGTNYLVLDNAESNDLLGNLRLHFERDFVFKRFISDYDGTAPTVASLYFYSPIQNISQSIAQQTALPYSPFKTYKQQGYRTVFITSGGLMWRNLGNYLPLQGVDECYDQNDIIEAFPAAKATLSYWGIADEYAFALAQKLLSESTEPLFINILSITNHPPYEIPPHYQAERIDPNSLAGKFGNEEENRKSLATYQYANNALGNFITNVSQSAVGNQTIIAATGDHHVRCVRFDAPKQNFMAKGVPFYVHVPTSLQNKLAIQFDPNRIGSHKDILPTLYALSLSDTEYWNIGGRNMLALEDDSKYAFAYNENLWADQEGVSDGASDVQYCWQNPTARYPENLWVEQLTPMSAQKKARIEAYKQLLTWQINYLVKGTK